MDHDHIDSTSPALMDSLENISESGEVESADKTAFASTSALPIEEDEQLTVEINTTTDPLNSTIVVNEIRFINNGVDVTDNVKAASLEREDTESSLDSLDDHAHNITSKTNEALSKSNNNQLADDEEASSSREGIKTKLKEIETDVAVMSSKLKTKINEADAEVKSFVRTKASNVNEVKIDVKKELSTPAEDIIHAASEIQDEYSTQREHMNQNFTTTKTELTSKVEEANETLTDKVDNTAKKAANAATEARDSLETAEKRAAAGARDAVETVGENSKRVANDTMSAMESIGNSAKRVATGAKNAVGNAFIKMSDGTKDAVDSVAAKIVNEVQGAKENMNTMFQSKHLKPTSIEEDAVSSASEAASKGGPKTNTTTTGEDDERTTASVNSTQNSTGNPFEGSNPFETSNPFEHDEFDDVVERGKKALQEEVNKVHQQVANEAQETEKETMGKVRRFFKDMGGISCRNEKSTTVDDEPPRYTVEDQYPTPTHRSQEHNNTSKVCSIL
uniref:Uncharacterized protein n=1 Tax=Ceratitis capitata TaxID=7213 RepID=W8CEH0_CERCA